MITIQSKNNPKNIQNIESNEWAKMKEFNLDKNFKIIDDQKEIIPIKIPPEITDSLNRAKEISRKQKVSEGVEKPKIIDNDTNGI